MSSKPTDPEHGSGANRDFERARRLAFERGLDSTIEQRLDWLDEMIEVARASGALAAEVERRFRLSNQHRLAERLDPPK